MAFNREFSEPINMESNQDLKTRVMVDKIEKKGKMYPYEITNHMGPVKAVAMNRDSTLFASCCPQDKKIFLYDAFTFQILNVFYCKNAVPYIQFTSDSQYIVGYSSMDGIYFFKVDDFTKTSDTKKLPVNSEHRMAEFEAFRIKGGDLSYGSDKLFLIREELFPGEQDYRINFTEVYNLKAYLSGNKKTTFSSSRIFSRKNKPQDAAIKGLFGLNPDIFYYATSTHLVKFDITNDDISIIVPLKENIKLSKITSMRMSKKYEFLGLAGKEGVSLVSPNDLTRLRYFPTEFPMYTVAFSPKISIKKDPKYHLIMGGGVSARDTAQAKQGGTEILLYNISSGKKMSQLTGHYGPVNYLDWYSDGAGFISAGEEGIVRAYRFDKSYFNDPQFK